jgi:hypothetical protein
MKLIVATVREFSEFIFSKEKLRWRSSYAPWGSGGQGKAKFEFWVLNFG